MASWTFRSAFRARIVTDPTATRRTVNRLVRPALLLLCLSLIIAASLQPAQSAPSPVLSPASGGSTVNRPVTAAGDEHWGAGLGGAGAGGAGYALAATGSAPLLRREL